MQWRKRDKSVQCSQHRFVRPNRTVVCRAAMHDPVADRGHTLGPQQPRRGLEDRIKALRAGGAVTPVRGKQ